uniref:Uncharacterized protein n=1 Tax=Neolamprologus brichardi TaxID=32507 RepID=A0A3Q4MNL4_NEOBR
LQTYKNTFLMIFITATGPLLTEEHKLINREEKPSSMGCLKTGGILIDKISCLLTKPCITRVL